MTARHTAGSESPQPRFIEIIDTNDEIRWRLDAGFLTSRWQCVWGAGCQGIHDTRQPELHDGCCSVGVVLADEEEAMNIAAIAATLSAEEMQFREAGRSEGFVHVSAGRWTTRVVDGACIFLNRPGFAAGRLSRVPWNFGGGPVVFRLLLPGHLGMPV